MIQRIYLAMSGAAKKLNLRFTDRMFIRAVDDVRRGVDPIDAMERAFGS